MSDIAAIRDVIAQFWRLRIATAGELTLRRTLRVSEAGLVAKGNDAIGGIGQVLSDLLELTVRLRAAVTVVGDDGVWYDLKGKVEELTFSSDYLQVDARWTTPVDYEIEEAGAVRRWRMRHTEPLDESLSLPLQMQMRAACRQHDGLIVVDRHWADMPGIIDDEIRRVVRNIAEQESRKRLVVWSDAPLGRYAGCWRYQPPGELPDGLADDRLETIAAAATEHRETYFFQTKAGMIVAPPDQTAERIEMTTAADFSPSAVLSAIAAAGIAGGDPAAAGKIGAAAATLAPIVTTGKIAMAIEKL
ncbi:hypothetical protein [Blastopirellula marina]|uniref:hypothetical protein n=1 Tax=Blastopirellula marina TaxID=124 RepID=UPI001304C03D|nr:hypothetical protein [Blastopirellula marina]